MTQEVCDNGLHFEIQSINDTYLGAGDDNLEHCIIKW
jgi:hypothetical protein